MSYRTTGLGLAALLAFAGTATAQKPAAEAKPADPTARLLQRMDRDGDGKISHEEYRNAMLRRFGARDKNADGKLEGEEFPKSWLAGAGIEDANHSLTLEEFSDQLEPTFNQFDTDRDGLLAGAEIQAFVSARQARRESTP
jgi:hypothetical protein